MQNELLEPYMRLKITNIICTKEVNVKYVVKVCVTHLGSKDICQPRMGLCPKVPYPVVIVRCFSAQKALKIIMSKNNMLIFSKFKWSSTKVIFLFLSFQMSRKQRLPERQFLPEDHLKQEAKRPKQMIPWGEENLDEFLYYCCPEWDDKFKESQSFMDHAIHRHED